MINDIMALLSIYSKIIILQPVKYPITRKDKDGPGDEDAVIMDLDHQTRIKTKNLKIEYTITDLHSLTNHLKIGAKTVYHEDESWRSDFLGIDIHQYDVDDDEQRWIPNIGNGVHHKAAPLQKNQGKKRMEIIKLKEYHSMKEYW